MGHARTAIALIAIFLSSQLLGATQDRGIVPEDVIAAFQLIPGGSPDATAQTGRQPRVARGRLPAPVDPYPLVSPDSLIATLEELTAIQPYSGWRNSATSGEAEAVAWLADELSRLRYLRARGLELEQQSFHVFLATELWETRLALRVDGSEVEVPADGLRGPRDDIPQALRFDSDGELNDSQRDPVVVEGPVVVIRSTGEIDAFSTLQGVVVFLDYSVVDRSVMALQDAVANAEAVLAKEPAGVILVTQFSNQRGESHGAFVGDASVLDRVEDAPPCPTLYVRLEDLDVAGISGWPDLADVDSAQLVWDTDVFSPGTSTNLVARIPGTDSSRAVILGAHIDSPNSPGAMDDGSGSAILLEVARVVERARVEPEVDLYLVWFGSEELGLYGSYHFVSTHQELLDRALAMLDVDCLTHPLDGMDPFLLLSTWPYGRFGDDRVSFPDYLMQTVSDLGVWAWAVGYYGFGSDNAGFIGFDVPNADLSFEDPYAYDAAGSFHYSGHVHDPYDTVELARLETDALEDMALVALTAAVQTARDDPMLRVTPPPQRRAVFVASHTEVVHMSPTCFTDLGMTLAWEGFDVDLVPYGQAVSSDDLVDASLVVVLPLIDYPSQEGDLEQYDESWSADEVGALDDYAAAGGLLVLTASAQRLKYFNRTYEANEDRQAMNPLGERFGVSFNDGSVSAGSAATVGSHQLIDGILSLELASGNAVPFTAATAQVLAQAGSHPVAALVEHGEGEVLVLADVGILGSRGEPTNLPFWQNLAGHARSR